MKTSKPNCRRGTLAESGAHGRFGKWPEMMQKQRARSRNTQEYDPSQGGNSFDGPPRLGRRRYKRHFHSASGPRLNWACYVGSTFDSAMAGAFAQRVGGTLIE